MLAVHKQFRWSENKKLTPFRAWVVHVYLSIRFYKNLDAGDNKTYLRTELYPKNKFGEPVVFGRVMDSEVKDGDRIATIRTAIEMGKNFDIAFVYERQLIRSNYETIKLDWTGK